MRVDDLAALLATLRAAGTPITDDEPLEGYDCTYIEDPFGNRRSPCDRLEAFAAPLRYDPC